MIQILFISLPAAGTSPISRQKAAQPRVFASVVPVAAVGTPNFSLSLSAQSATVAPGGSANVTINVSAVGGFNGQISLSCAAPNGVTCALNPSLISPGSSTSSSTLTISANSTPPANGYGSPGMALPPGLGLFGVVPTTRKRKPFAGKSMLWMSVLGSLLLISLMTLGCGSNNSKQQTTTSRVAVMVTGTSGVLSHTTPITVNIN